MPPKNDTLVLRAPSTRCWHLWAMRRDEDLMRRELVFHLTCALCTDEYRVSVTHKDVFTAPPNRRKPTRIIVLEKLYGIVSPRNRVR